MILAMEPVSTWAAMGTAVVLILTALGSTAILIIQAISASKDRREASEERKMQLNLAVQAKTSSAALIDKSDEIISSTSKIHELTNSTNSNLQKALELMTQKVQSLELAAVKAEEVKRDLAASHALTEQSRILTPSRAGEEKVIL